MPVRFAILFVALALAAGLLALQVKPVPHQPATVYTPPKGYVCYRTTHPLVIDGKLNEADWQSVPWTDDFADIEGSIRPKPRFRTRAKMLWDDRFLYLAAELEEPHVQGTFTKRDSYIFHEDNDFEVFIDPDGDSHNYVELEMNALNTVWDLRLTKPYKDRGKAEDNWDIAGLKTAVHVNGTINDPRDTDTGWTLEIAIPWDALRKLTASPAASLRAAGGPADGDYLRLNFSRVEWRYDIVDGKYVRVAKSKEDNWVWSPQSAINMHMPERWGYLQFSTKEAHRLQSVGSAEFRPDPTGPARHVLHRVYYAQHALFTKHRHYARTLAELELKNLNHESLAGPPVMESTGEEFLCTVTLKQPLGNMSRVRIHSDARVELLP